MEKDELKELEDYYNNLLLMGETSFVYGCFEISKTKDGKWKLANCINYLVDESMIEELIIPDFIQIIGAGAFEDYPYSVYELIIPEGVERIELKAFRCCVIRNLKLPCTLKYIGDCAFSRCNIEELYIPDNVEEIGEMAFYKNAYLNSVSLPSGISLQKWAFEGTGIRCSKIATLEVRKRTPRTRKLYIKANDSTFYNSSFEELAINYIKK